MRMGMGRFRPRSKNPNPEFLGAPPRGNFVRLNLKRKSYSRASMRGKFLRKQVWKQKWRKKFGGGADVCFRCGGKGHWASECRGKDLGSFPEEIPQEKPLLTLDEAAQRTNGDFTPEIPGEKLNFGISAFSQGIFLSTLLLLPTGSGKSLCYQLPAFLYHRRSRCISIVISPLISLMDDQVSGLPSALTAVCIHSNLTPSQREAAIEKVRSGQAQILLLSPESVTGSGFFSRLFRHFPPVAFACLDEAHCISHWSHNFRPAYLRVCKVLRERVGVRCFLGLTATATVATARDVAKHLGIAEGNPTI
ncbi:LOW QUALITY PROTEIN: ATP-dependent DNA helicase Q4, partial [Passerculus sandwichensis]